MTDYTDLIARLRLYPATSAAEAADALEAQGRRLAEAEALLRVMPGYGLSAYDPRTGQRRRRSMSYLTPMDVAEAEDTAADALDKALDWPYSKEAWDQIDAERVELLAANEALSDRLSIANSSNSDLRKERDTLTDRLAEAMRLLAKEGIHMDDHGCWCNPTVTDYRDSKVKHE